MDIDFNSPANIEARAQANLLSYLHQPKPARAAFEYDPHGPLFACDGCGAPPKHCCKRGCKG